jgi:ubiquinol-cytochrome c reductase cytochrome c subunit
MCLLLLAVAPVVLTFVLWRPVPAASAGVSSSVTLEARAGQAIYEERCASCHGEGAQGTGIAPPILGLGPAYYDFMMSTGRMPLDEPTQQAIRRRPVLTRAQIDQVTAYLVSLSPQGTGIPIPSVDPSAGNLSAGQSVYEENCAACHGTTGNGGAVGPRDAPNVHEATSRQIGEAVRIGPTTMPRFDPKTLSYSELNSLVRYVLYLRHPEDRGGQPLNRTGPLIEGFVAILLGLGVLILITRFIGERS